MLRICARKVSDTPKPAASSDERVMRKPDDKCSTDFAKEAWLTDRFRCAATDEMLVLTTNAMTYSFRTAPYLTGESPASVPTGGPSDRRKHVRTSSRPRHPFAVP